MQSLEKLKPLSLLLLRLALGAIFVYHGYPKLFGHTREAVQGFVRLGFPGYFAYISGLIEFFGGWMLIAGLFTRVAGMLLAIEMAVGIWKVGHLAADPMAVRNYETPLVLCAPQSESQGLILARPIPPDQAAGVECGVAAGGATCCTGYGACGITSHATK